MTYGAEPYPFEKRLLKTLFKLTEYLMRENTENVKMDIETDGIKQGSLKNRKDGKEAAILTRIFCSILIIKD